MRFGLACLGLLLALPASAQELDLRFTTLTTASQPVDIAHAGDGSGRLFLAEQSGRIRIWDGQQLLEQPFLDLNPLVSRGGERGLLGLAFAPDYASSGQFYVNYTNIGGVTTIARYRVSADDPDRADPDSAQILMLIDQPFSNHNGGQILFGPNDGYLYIASGDGGSGGDPLGNGQNPGTLLGKVLRIDVSTTPYTVPADNPFVGQAGARAEIWSLGLRNPWRMAFDPANGDLYIADVGQDAQEEVDWIPAGSGGGQNFGWNITEGELCFLTTPCDRTGLSEPIFVYSQSGAQAIIGGRVYRGSRYPAMEGIYFFADAISGALWGTRREGGAFVTRSLSDGSGDATPLPGVRTFGVDELGNLYVSSSRGLQLISDGPPAPAALPIGPGFTGAWYDPLQSGHGLFLEVLPPAPGQTQPRLLAWWFSFTPDGEQAWFGGTGPIEGDRAIVTVVQTRGGRWIPNFDPAQVVNEAWGSFVIYFTACDRGVVEFSADIGGFGSGSMQLTRLTQPAGLSCP